MFLCIFFRIRTLIRVNSNARSTIKSIVTDCCYTGRHNNTHIFALCKSFRLNRWSFPLNEHFFYIWASIKSFPPNHFHSRPHSYRCHCIITIYTECSGISFTPVIIIRSTIFICQNIIIIIRNFYKYPVLVCKSLNRLRNSIISCSEYYLCIRVKRILFYFCVKRIIVGNPCILPQLRTIIKCPAFQLRSLIKRNFSEIFTVLKSRFINADMIFPSVSSLFCFHSLYVYTSVKSSLSNLWNYFSIILIRYYDILCICSLCQAVCIRFIKILICKSIRIRFPWGYSCCFIQKSVCICIWFHFILKWISFRILAICLEFLFLFFCSIFLYFPIRKRCRFWCINRSTG